VYLVQEHLPTITAAGKIPQLLPVAILEDHELHLHGVTVALAHALHQRVPEPALLHGEIAEAEPGPRLGVEATLALAARLDPLEAEVAVQEASEAEVLAEAVLVVVDSVVAVDTWVGEDINPSVCL
jgi:hypothetical protein